MVTPARRPSRPAARGRDRDVRRRPPRARAVLEAALANGRVPAVVTFDPHPAPCSGNQIELLPPSSAGSSCSRRSGWRTCCCSSSPPSWPPASQRSSPALPAPDREARSSSRGRASASVGGGRRPEPARAAGVGVPTGVPGRGRLLEPRSASCCARARSRRPRGCSAGRRRSRARSSPATRGAARSGSRRRTSPSPRLLVPGIRHLRGRRARRRASSRDLDRRESALRRRERRIEAFLLDFQGDLYGRRLRVELWRRLRDERAFESETELVAQIARDVEETRAAVRPSSADKCRKQLETASSKLRDLSCMEGKRSNRISNVVNVRCLECNRLIRSRSAAALCCQSRLPAVRLRRLGAREDVLGTQPR